MTFITVFLLALSVAADAFAVSVATGISEKKIRIQNALKMAFCFGFFQTIMPIIGFILADIFSSTVEIYDHWIAFILLLYIGGNMVHEGWKGEDENKQFKNIFELKSLIILGIATSIDALAVGISLTATTDSIFFPAFSIGCVTFIVSFLGLKFGNKWGGSTGKNAEIIGGLILVGIGTKILIEHTFF